MSDLGKFISSVEEYIKSATMLDTDGNPTQQFKVLFGNCSVVGGDVILGDVRIPRKGVLYTSDTLPNEGEPAKKLFLAVTANTSSDYSLIESLGHPDAQEMNQYDSKYFF